MSEAKKNCNGLTKNHFSGSLTRSNSTKKGEFLDKVDNKYEKNAYFYSYFSSINSAKISRRKKSCPKLRSYTFEREHDWEMSQTNNYIKYDDTVLQETNSIFQNKINMNGKPKFINDKIKVIPKKLKKKGVQESSKEVRIDKNKGIKLSEENKFDIKINYPDFINRIGISKEAQIFQVIDEINEELKKEPCNPDELIPKIKLLYEVSPIIDPLNISDPLLNTDDFDIFRKNTEKNFVFQINLCNLLSIINLLYIIIEDQNKFIECLDKLGLNFSFVKRYAIPTNKEIDLVLLAPESSKLYNYISTYGKELFSKDSTYYKTAEIFSNSQDKQLSDEGYYFEQYSSMNLLNKIGEENYQINPKMLYYLKPEGTTKLKSKHLIKKPESYEFSETYKKADGTTFEGYNEIDICFTLSKNIEIKENENLSTLKYSSEEEEVIQGPILLEKDMRYITEIKSNIKDIVSKKSLADIKKKYNRFNEAFENIEKVQNIKTHNKKSTLLLLSDKSIIEVKNQIKSNHLNENFIYSNPQVGMSFIFELNDKINYINRKTSIEIATLKENNLEKNNQIATFQTKIQNNEKEITALQTKIQNNEKEITALQTKIDNNEIENANLKNEMMHMNFDKYDIKKETLKHFNFIKPDLLTESLLKKSSVSDNIMNSLGDLYSCFYSISKSYLDIMRFQGKKTLYEDIKPFIGKRLETVEEVEQWKGIYEKISTKSKKNSTFSKYYQALLKFLFGEKYVSDNLTSIDKDILSEEKSDKREMVKKLILFLEVCEENDSITSIEQKFQSVVFYICIKLEIVNVMINIFAKKKAMDVMFTELISCINQENVYF